MTNSREISQLRQKQKAIRHLTHESYVALAKVDSPQESKFSIDGLGIIANRAIGKVLKLLSPDLTKIKELEMNFRENPSKDLARSLLTHARELLGKKMNADAVRVLSTLTRKKVQKAILLLGSIFMNGVKDRIGKLEFRHPQNAMKCLTLGFECGNIEAGYLLGALFRTFGQNQKAKEIFAQNMEKGCVKSAAEFIILLQIEAASSPDEKSKAIIEQRIKNLRTDLTYSPS
ncbi:hypothetical protein [Photobacterium galatheae]|uniref:Uncharacterized protein n=1 Tax=Photobacterium galatheae TaxID=1654360 RepID=A0A066RRE2_9GAMM|nr:hypothetical protein [Photobacterium galatheae]KDM89973.1 hypothetical protein EA58_19710 [Photobacterium galatheae]MCM0149232.1 hypothetical protein [Photobacterium galatheae]